MIKNAAVPASRVSSETKKIRKASNSLSTLAPVIRPPQGETIKTAEIAPRMVRSLGSVQSMKVLEKKSTKTGKNSPVIIKKAGPGTRTGPGPLRGQVTSGSGPEPRVTEGSVGSWCHVPGSRSRLLTKAALKCFNGVCS